VKFCVDDFLKGFLLPVGIFEYSSRYFSDTLPSPQVLRFSWSPLSPKTNNTLGQITGLGFTLKLIFDFPSLVVP